MALELGDLDDALRALEARVRAFQPRCEFYFGGAEEEQERQKSPPYVHWTIEPTETSEETREVADTDRTHFCDDLIPIRARCAGLAATRGPDVRRQQHAASLQVVLAVSASVHEQHQGYFEDRGWASVGPKDIAESCYPIDYTFCLRAGRWTPAIEQVQPETAEGTAALEPPP